MKNPNEWMFMLTKQKSAYSIEEWKSEVNWGESTERIGEYLDKIPLRKGRQQCPANSIITVL